MVYNIMLSTEAVLLLPLLFWCALFLFLAWLLCLGLQALWMIRIDKSGYSYLIFDLRGQAFNLSSLSMIWAVVLSYMDLIMLRYVPLLWLSWWRICLQYRIPQFDPWVGKIHWRRGYSSIQKENTPVFWPGEFHGLYSPRDHKELGTTEWLSFTLSCFSTPNLLRVSTMKRCWVLSNAFCTSVETIISFFLSISVVCHTYWYTLVEPSFHLRDKSHLSMSNPFNVLQCAFF